MGTNVVGLFDTEGKAQGAVQDLLAAGFDHGAISIVASNPQGQVVHRELDDHATATGETAFKGAEGGAVVGGLVGLLVGLGALAVPGVGLIIAGPLAGLVFGAASGAVAGGIIGGLVGLGIPEEDAHVYAESIRRGGVMVTVSTTDELAPQAEAILDRDGAVNIEERKAAYRAEGFTTYDPDAPAVARSTTVREETVTTTPEAPRVRSYSATGGDDLYRRHYDENLAQSGMSYEGALPAYRFGYQAATRPELAGRDWDSVEPQIRQEWESSHPGTWQALAGAIRAAYESARARTVPNRASVL